MTHNQLFSLFFVMRMMCCLKQKWNTSPFILSSQLMFNLSQPVLYTFWFDNIWQKRRMTQVFSNCFLEIIEIRKLSGMGGGGCLSFDYCCVCERDKRSDNWQMYLEAEVAKGRKMVLENGLEELKSRECCSIGCYN